ncbi:MAG: DUF1294 domain-containing protein [Planctomycetota bacterium]|jgi:uncharacterized membrane protein YsdA (DUF1294 family)|nr:DUF1294 domain-containing protein [Planctomycetota bacterium]
MSETLWLGLAVWAGLINAIACGLMGIDKRRARRQVDRISEWHLLVPVLLGGAPGSLAGMLLFRHKTRKRSFQAKWLLACLASLSAIGAGAWWLTQA